MAKKVNKTETATVATLNIPRYTLSLLYTLLNVPLHGPQLRARNVFAKMVRSELATMEDERIKMLEARAKKDKNGEFIKINAGTQEEQYDIDTADLKKYQVEFDKYMHENWMIDLLPSIKQSIVLLRPLILESKTPLGTVDGYAYEDIATAFEAM